MSICIMKKQFNKEKNVIELKTIESMYDPENLSVKRCRICGEFFKMTDLRCPCCRVLVRSHSRYNKSRKKRVVKRI